MAWLQQPYRLGRWAALAVVTAAVLVLVPATNAAAEVVRLRVDWAPSDGRTAMHAPYLFARTDEMSYSYQSPCPTGCGPWVEGNFDAGGRARTISFVDRTATQYSSYRFSIAHPFGGFGPNVVGTATITHADGRSYVVPFDIPPGSGSGMVQEVSLGDSQGLPRPPRSPSPREPGCTINDLKQQPRFYRSLGASIRGFLRRWRTGEPLLLGPVLACASGKVTGRVVRIGRGRPALIGKGTRTTPVGQGQGFTSVKVKPTRRGRSLRARGRSFRARLTIRVFDADGASVTYSRARTLRGG